MLPVVRPRGKEARLEAMSLGARHARAGSQAMSTAQPIGQDGKPHRLRDEEGCTLRGKHNHQPFDMDN